MILPVSFENGTLEVDVCSGLNALAPDYYARGLAGLAYRISVAPALTPASQGHIGLFVDIGTEAYFSNLRIAQA